MRRAKLGVVSVGLWLLLALPALAQDGSVRVLDPDGVLGAGDSAVRAAAERLANEGAEVIVIAAGSSAGTTPASADQFLDTVLSQNNLAPSRTQLKPSQIVFFVARDARQTSLRFGQRWISTLQSVEARIQSEQMNPRFADGDIAGGLAAGLDAVRTTINPPNTALYVIGGVLATTAVGAVAVPVLRKRRAAAETLAGVRERAAQARRAAGVAIADLGQLVRNAEDKAQYDRISYATADVERLQTLQGNGLQLFQQAQAAFDAAEELENAKAAPEVNDYEAIIAQYNQARDVAAQATVAIREAEQLRSALDARGTPSTGGTTRLNQ